MVGMRDVLSAAVSLPWMIGLAVALAALSLRRYERAHGGNGARWQRVYEAGLLLTFAGLVLVSSEPWRRVLSGAATLLYAGSLWAERRRERAPREHPAPEG